MGSSWKTWFHSGDHTQNLKMPENFIPCNYKNKSKINLPLSSSPIPRRPWMNGNPKEAIPEVTPSPKPWLWPSPKLAGPSGVPSPLKQAHKYYLPRSTHQHLVLQRQELVLYVPNTLSFFLSFLAVVQSLSFPWKKQDTEWVGGSSVGKIIIKMRFGDKFYVSSAISLPLSSSKCYLCFKSRLGSISSRKPSKLPSAKLQKNQVIIMKKKKWNHLNGSVRRATVL